MASDERTSSVPVVPEEQLLRELQEWEAVQVTPPTLFDVVRTRKVNLTAAFVLRGFRSAAKEAVRAQDRVFHLRNLVYAAFGDPYTGDDFLRAFHPALRRTPLEAALASPDGMVDAIKSLPEYVRAVGLLSFNLISRRWWLTNQERAQLLDCSAAELASWELTPWRLPDEALERIALLLAISKALPRLLPSEAAREWVKLPDQAHLFGGVTALDLMIRDGVSGMRLVRNHLEAEFWST